MYRLSAAQGRKFPDETFLRGNKPLEANVLPLQVLHPLRLIKLDEVILMKRR